MGTSTVTVSRGTVTVPADFVGNHFQRVVPVNGQYRRWHSHDAIGCGWYQVNTADGVYDWSDLDAYVAALDEGDGWTYDVWGTPNWLSARPAEAHTYGAGVAAEPTDMSKLAAFVTALCNRYPSLNTLEAWNEPDVTQPPIWFSGTVAKFVEMTQTIRDAAKAVRTSIKVIGPGTANYISKPNWFAAFIAAGGLTHLDAIALHCYQLQWSTRSVPLLGICHSLQYHYQALSAAGIAPSSWEFHCTEFGQFNPGGRSMPDDEYIALFKRSMVTAAAAGFKQANWYAYDDSNMGYSGKGAVLAAIAEFIPVLCGATVANCVINMPELTVTADINGQTYTF